MKKTTLIYIALLVVAMVASRLVPHAPNFTALTGIALFSGAFFARGWWGYLAPILGMVALDLYFGFYNGVQMTYVAVLLMVSVAPSLKSRYMDILGRSVVAAILFFTISNLGVWLFSGLYPMSAAGFVDCYVMAIPFFGNTLLSAVVSAPALFFCYRLITRAVGETELVHGR